MKKLIISHSIWLTEQERKELQENDIEVIGVSVPVWVEGTKTDEPASEVFCKYIIRQAEAELPVEPMPEGYLITLNKKEYCRRVLSVGEGGNGGFAFFQSDVMTIDGEEVLVIHQTSILERETLDRSIYLSQRSQTDFK